MVIGAFGLNLVVILMFTSETFGYFGKKEYEKNDKITKFFDSREKAQRVGNAFARILEICSVENKEPF